MGRPTKEDLYRELEDQWINEDKSKREYRHIFRKRLKDLTKEDINNALDLSFSHEGYYQTQKEKIDTKREDRNTMKPQVITNLIFIALIFEIFWSIQYMLLIIKKKIQFFIKRWIINERTI